MKAASLAACSSRYCGKTSRMTPRLQEYLDAALRIYSATGRVTLRAVGEETKTSPSTIFEAMSRLVTLGHMKRVDWGGYSHCYVPSKAVKPATVSLLETLRLADEAGYDMPEWLTAHRLAWQI